MAHTRVMSDRYDNLRCPKCVKGKPAIQWHRGGYRAFTRFGEDAGLFAICRRCGFEWRVEAVDE